MSENLDLVRSNHAGWQRGDFGGSGDALADLGPEEWAVSEENVELVRAVLSAYENPHTISTVCGPPPSPGSPPPKPSNGDP
jgi:hypothetical protein